MTEDTNGAPAATEAKEAKARAPRAPRQRGPPEDGVASKTKVMVANLPYDLTEEKASFHHLFRGTFANSLAAQGVVLRLRPGLCQDRSSPHSPLHGQEASGSW